MMCNFFTKHRLDKICSAMDENMYISALRRGLSLCIPFFLVGSLALALINLPIPGYHNFLAGLWDGRLMTILLWTFYGTMGILALIMIVSVSYSFGQRADPEHSGSYPIACVVSYIAFALEPDCSFRFEMLGHTWLFTAVLVTLTCCSLLRLLLKISQNWHNKHYQEGIDLDFRYVMVSLLPIASCIFIFIIVKIILTTILGSVDLQNIGSAIFISIFEKVGTGFGGAVLFIFLIHILWFFGIHGSNMMNMVSMGMFELGINTNMTAIAAGLEPPVLFTKTFFDCFILMGGSGATICLLIALIIGTKRKSTKSLFKFSVFPSIFNINELVLFGLPVVFNPIMLIPFLLVPLVLLCTSSAAMALGLVPFCSHAVEWTAPIIFSGYASTGSWSGAVLQIVNVAIGTIIYLPFIKLSEKYYNEILSKNVSNLQNAIIEREETGNTSSLRSSSYQSLHEVIKLLTTDLKYALSNHKISLFYQPQFTCDGKLYGVEALLRWNHPSLGFLYPPMVIELARDDGMIQQLGYQIIETSANSLERLAKETNYPIHMAVNISPVQLEDPDFCNNIRKMLKKHDFRECKLCFEITEQIALASTKIIQERISELHEMGILFHMDDFGMGHSSMIYLQNNYFSAVKLDGSLVRDMMKNKRSQEIIGGIHNMSQSLNYDLIAEYVETEEQRDALNELGCHIYQGYLYSPALKLSELEKFLHENDVIANVSDKKYSDSELYL